MANIRNSISLTDRMTPTLRSILKAMDSTLRVMRQLDRASNNGTQSKAYRRAEQDIRRANNALIKMKNHTDMVGSAATRAAAGYGTWSKTLSSIGTGLQAIGRSSTQFLQSLASGVYLAQRLAKAIEGVMTKADTARSQVARLGLYNTSEYSNEELYGQVMATAMATRSDLSATADLVNRILLSGVYSGADAPLAAIGTADIINKALVAGGGTKEENNRALIQLNQGLSSGILQGDELRSIREQAPYLAKTLAEGLAQIDKKFEGIGIGDLKELGAQGELTSDRVVKAFWAMQDEINEDFKKMPKTFGQAMTSLSNIWQYFLYLLSGTDGPLGKINNKLWQLVDYLQSPAGFELMEGIATGISFISWMITGVMQGIGNFIKFLQDHTDIAKAAFIGLGAIGVVTAISVAVSWLAACWPVLLLAVVVGAVSYAFMSMGFTATQVIGAIIGGVLWLVAVIWDAVVVIVDLVMWCGIIIAEAFLALLWVGVFVLQVIVQLILWVITTIWAAIVVIVSAIVTIFLSLWEAVKGVFSLIVNGVFNMVDSCISKLYALACAIDAIFGSNLASAVAGFMGKVDAMRQEVNDWIDMGGSFDVVGNMWTENMGMLGDMYAGNGAFDGMNITDNMDSVAQGFASAMDATWGAGASAENWITGGLVNPGDWYDAGNQWVAGVGSGLGGFELGIPDSSVLDAFNADGVQVSGGDLDSVGSIKSDVNLNEEDIKLLRDMTARDYLLQLQTITPVANVTFGDVRETADVGRIVEVIEQMVDEQMATALVS